METAGKTTTKDDSNTNSTEEQFISLKNDYEEKKKNHERELAEIAILKEQINKLTIEISTMEAEVPETEPENPASEVEDNETNLETQDIELDTSTNDNPIEAAKEEERVEKVVEQAITLVENENEGTIENELAKVEIEAIKEKSDKKTTILNKVGSFLFKQIKRKFVKYVLLPASIATAVTLSYTNPEEYYDMYQNYKERHFDKNNKDDPNIVGINNLYNDSTDIERTTYDFLGDHKINYKRGYYMTSVFDLSDKTPPRFKLINDREHYNKLDSVAGITTNLFKKFYKFGEFVPQLKGHENKDDAGKGEIAMIGYNTKTQTIKAGHFKEFNDDWLVSETYEIPLNFKLNADNTINLVYHAQAMRMVPLTTNEQGAQIPFPIGITYDKDTKKINPYECNRFGTLEGGKVIMVCGEKQLQVNGSFSDIFKVYERLQKENKGGKIQAYLLDNGSYNLPIWDNDSTITTEEIKSHFMRNPDGGTALALVSDGKISPYEYKSKYKEFEHYTPNYTLDSITGKPAKNEKTVIVIHHTGNYEHSEDIIKQFEDTTAETSAHVLILKDGTRHLFNTDNYVLAHAGKSDFNDKNKVNYFSLGIEMEGDTKNATQFTVAQLESMLEYLRPRIEKYKIPYKNITTHKIIRDNYIKKHPNEHGVLTKRDLDDQVWKQIQNLIDKKIYQREKVKPTPNGKKMVGSLIYQNSYRQTKNKDYSAKQTMAFLAKYNAKSNNNKTIDWIRNTV